jgi:hypothetical protein
MAEIILNIGNSGSGKSSGLRNLPADQTLIIKPNSKSLPFPGGDAKYISGKNLVFTEDMLTVRKALEQAKDRFKYYVIEDMNHFFNSRTTSATFIAQKDGGAAFAKWNQFAADIINSFVHSAKILNDNAYLILIAHTEIKEDGTIGLQTSGKLLDTNLFIPGYVTYVLHSLVTGDSKDPNYIYLTNYDGIHLAKSPAGSLEKTIPNDLMKVLGAIDTYKKGESKLTVKWKE